MFHYNKFENLVVVSVKMKHDKDQTTRPYIKQKEKNNQMSF